MSDIEEVFGAAVGVGDVEQKRTKGADEQKRLAELRVKYGLDRCRLPPYDHQVDGVDHIVTHPFAGLFDEMGAGKTKQTIDAAQVLFSMGLIDRVLIIAPASIRSVWFDPELGELAKHGWASIKHVVTEFHAKTRRWEMGEGPVLQWCITNYEFIRSKQRLIQLRPFTTQKTLLVSDESSAIKSYRAQQTKACMMLRKQCGRVLLLNGTPIANNPGDLFSQGQLMSKKVLDCETWIHYRSRYAIMGQLKNVPTAIIVGWTNLEDLQRRFAPYVIRRLKKDCLDLPEKLPPVTLEVPLTPESWKIYKEMRDEMVAWLSDSAVATASVAAVKVLRLAQVTSGFIGGVETLNEDDYRETEERPQFLPGAAPVRLQPSNFVDGVNWIGSEKHDFAMDWFKERLEVEGIFKLLMWCRFKPELFRLLKSMAAIPGVAVHGLYGGQKRAEREATLRAIDPRTTPPGSLFVGGTFGTGSKGLSATAIHTAFNFSYGYSHEQYQQSADRIHRPGQVESCSYFDLAATGPQGQRTVDHLIIKARRKKEDVANWTASAWIRALLDE